MELLLFVVAIAAAVYWWSHRNSAAEPTGEPPTAAPRKPLTAADRDAAHVRDAIKFAEKQRSALRAAGDTNRKWREQHAGASVGSLDTMGGVAFEHFLAGLLGQEGYSVETTAASGDYGADLIATRGVERIAIQAKRWKDIVGVGAVQEAIAGMAYYKCTSAWVITTSRFTYNARELAQRSGVKLTDRSALAQMMKAK